MEYILSSKEMQESDAYTISLGTPSLELMERAGKACFDIIKKYINKDNLIIVAAGSGGNGGDGYVVSRLLLNEGYNVKVLPFGNHYKEETLINKNLYKGEYINSLDDLPSKKIVIIDALLGVGLSKTLKDEYVDLINSINLIDAFKVSIDVNSGIDATTGFSLGAYIKSNLTIAINNFKYGHYFNEGISAYDELKVVDIQIRGKNPSFFAKSNELVDFQWIFSRRNRDSNKGTYGKVALIGGSKFTPGAINLSLNALASLRGGVGYTMVVVPKSLYPLYALRNNENIYSTLSDNDGQVIFVEEEIKKILHYDAIAIGMGIGTSFEVYKIILYLLENYTGNLLIDADGLNSLSRFGIDALSNHKCEVILTPHIKEFSRLSGLEISEIKKDYIGHAKNFAKQYDVVINLKNDVSVITDGNEVFINKNGNAGLAKGGSGDVLSGITLSLITKKDLLVERVACGAYILGKSSELAVEEINEYSLLARDLSSYLIKIINELTKRQ